ncbi:MAG: hypothetical protein ABR592_01970 [Nitriliruptorales bacterium]
MALHPDFQDLKDRHEAAKRDPLENALRARLELDAQLAQRAAETPPMPEANYGTASMVLGILSIVFFWIPLIGLGLAVPAVALSVPGLLRQPKDGQSIAGLTTGLVGLPGALFITSMFVVGFILSLAEELVYNAI